MTALVLLIIIFFVVFPMVKGKLNSSSLKSGAALRSGVRNPKNYGNVTLDGVQIAKKGTGVLNPSAMYSDTKRTKENSTS